MSDNPYTRLFEDDEYVVHRRAVAVDPAAEILTQDDRFEVDGEPVRITSGMVVGELRPDGTVQMLAWDGMVSAPTIGRIELDADRPQDDE